MAKVLNKFGGVPAGGSDNHVLTKQSGSDHDVGWEAGGSSPVTVIETADFQLDPAGDHPDRCVVVLTGSNSSGSFPFVKLPLLANQPDPGYMIHIVVTDSNNAGIGLMSNSELIQASGSYTAMLTYVGGNYWRFGALGGVVAVINEE